MSDSEKKEFPKPNLVFEGGALISIQIKKPKETADGDVTEPSKTVLAIAYDTEDLERYFGVLARLLRKDRPITTGLSFVEQLELPKPKAGANGSAPATANGLEPIQVPGERPSERAMRESDGGKSKPKKREKAKA